jgi:integrase
VSVVVGELGIAAVAAPRRPAQANTVVGQFPPRPVPRSWPATRLSREKALQRLASTPLVGDRRRPNRQAHGVETLLDWLADQPGSTWQERWLASGADAAPTTWRQVPEAWLRDRGHGPWRREALVAALPVAVGGDLLRPSLAWLVGGGPARGGRLVRLLAAARDPDGFARLRDLCGRDSDMSAPVTSQTLFRCAQILAAKGGTLADIVVGDVVELFAAEDHTLTHAGSGRTAFYRILRELGVFGSNAPPALRGLRTVGQRSPEELIDRYGIVPGPIRDLLIEYLRERQPALDYTSLDALSYYLGKRFWADIEAHHPGIDSLNLPREVADGWKRRLRTITKTKTTPTGEKVQVTVDRVNYRECLTPVRAFYLDLAHWAVEDPGRWGPWVAPCPVGDEEINRRKAKRHLKARMDARTRERLPVLPVLVRSVDERRKTTRALLDAARATQPGQTFTAAGQTLRRAVIDRGAADTIWAEDPTTGKRRNLSREEDHAFWAWAIVEVLRATGIRVEELLELSHHSLVQYRLPTTGELVPLLQIVPSKTDAERLLVVSPELAEVLATIIHRIRDRQTGAVPLVAAYDVRERLWLAPAPVLFQRRIGTENRAIPLGSVGRLLSRALAHTGLVNPVDGTPLHYTPHDFRRMFITDAILNGLPPHIAQVIAGHRDINVTIGYKAAYPDEAIQAHLAFLARRRALRPSEEYRVPTDAEWQEFLGHFERRKVAIGTCARAFGTPCVHEHSCIRCSMLWPDPTQRARLVEIRDSLLARIAEAEREGWLGEVEGLRVSLAGTDDKLAQIDSRPRRSTTVHLGLPTITHPASAPQSPSC